MQSPGFDLLSPIERVRDNRHLSVQKMMGRRKERLEARCNDPGEVSLAQKAVGSAVRFQKSRDHAFA